MSELIGYEIARRTLGIKATRNKHGKDAGLNRTDFESYDINSVHNDLMIAKFKLELQKFEGMRTTIYIKDGRWMVPIEDRFKGWEKIEGIEEYVCTEKLIEIKLLEG